jgi:hypothetical protein
MVLHSAVHLFHDGEFSHGLRHLSDIHRLPEQSDARRILGLASPRVPRTGLGQPLFHALRYAYRMLATALPPAVWNGAAPCGPDPWLPRMMDSLFLWALRPAHPS